LFLSFRTLRGISTVLHIVSNDSNVISLYFSEYVIQFFLERCIELHLVVRRDLDTGNEVRIHLLLDDITFLRATNRATRLFWQVVGQQPALMSPLLERRGVTALLRFRPGAHWQGDFVVASDGGPALELLTSPDAQPPVFAARRVEIVDDDAGWLQAALRLGSEVRQAAIVDRRELPAFFNPPASATIRIKERTPMATVLDVDAQGPGPSFLAFNQTWDEGWRLTVDERPASLLRTDVSLSGFVVPPGTHRATIEYGDTWVSVGATISMVAALVCLALVWVGRRRSQSRLRQSDAPA